MGEKAPVALGASLALCMAAIAKKAEMERISEEFRRKNSNPDATGRKHSSGSFWK